MSLVRATVVKEEQSSKLGIAFERENENYALMIKLVREDGLFANSDIVPGLVVVSAMGIDMSGKSPKDVADALKDAPGGEPIELVCKGSKVTILKDKVKRFGKPAKLGISFKSTTAKPGKVFVSDIKPESKFLNTDLKIGHRVLAINGKVCPTRVAGAVELLKDATDEITIISIDPQDETYTPPVVEEKEPEPIVEDRSMDMVEEKKDDVAESAATGESTKDEEEEDTTPEANKPLLDTVFGACIC
jgi:predicted metalloprotease with PDZ domain